MAQNFVQYGKRVEYTVPASTTITSGQVLTIGQLTGIALNGGTEGDTITVQVDGVFNITKATPLAITQGDRLFYNAGTSKVTKTTTDTPLGIAFASAGSSDTTVNVLLYEGGTPPQAAAVTDITTADGTDAATTQALANATKAKVNALLASLRAAGILDA